MNSRHVFQEVFFLGIVFLLAGSGSNVEPPVVNEIQAQPCTTIQTGETASLTIPVSGTELQFEWTVLRGTLSDPTRPAVIYTAPNTPGFDTVTVTITNDGGAVIKNINFEVVAPPPTPTLTATNTPVPTDTPTATPIPLPITCNNPAITKNVFPQLADVKDQYPFYGPLDEPNFLCAGVYDLSHSGPLAAQIEYKQVGENYGFFGVVMPNGYDIRPYSEICFWAYAQEPNQPFYLKLKDTDKREEGVKIFVEFANQWNQICTPLTEFSNLGIHLNQLENINLGFDSDNGNAEVWVDDFEFK